VQRGAEVDAPGFKTGQTPLQWAASRGHVQVVDLLASLGASAARADSCGYQGVHYAAQNGQSMMTYYLVSRWGAEALEAVDLEGHTPLHWAVHNGHLETVRLLIAQRADLHRADNAGMTPLHWACYQGHYQVVQALMQAGASLAAKDRAGKSYA
jgi:ankyrin repeat protein